MSTLTKKNKTMKYIIANEEEKPDSVYFRLHPDNDGDMVVQVSTSRIGPYKPIAYIDSDVDGSCHKICSIEEALVIKL